MPLSMELKKSEPFPAYYDTLCTFTCPHCGGLMIWGAFECVGACEACIDEVTEIASIFVHGEVVSKTYGMKKHNYQPSYTPDVIGFCMICGVKKEEHPYDENL